MARAGSTSGTSDGPKIRIRPLALDDFDTLVALGDACFPGMPSWRRHEIISQLRIFPEGQFGIEYEGKLVASCSSLIVQGDDYSDWHDWALISDQGRIRNHNPDGDTLYGIEMMVHPDFQGKKLARRLYESRKQLVRDRNLARIIVGGRIPGYGQYADQMSAKEYVQKVVEKHLYDPVLTPQLANEFVLKGLIPNYFPEDSASKGYATHLEWTNPMYVPEVQAAHRTRSQIRLCVLQYQLRSVQSFEQFATQAEFFVDVASDYRADFLVFPELFTTELMATVGERRPGLAARKLADYTPQYIDLFTNLAMQYHVNIVGGSTFVIEEDRLYNVAYLFRRDGTVDSQTKTHITPDERKWWGVSKGTESRVFDTDRGKIAIQLSYDVLFPELARWAAHKGANVLFVPFNTDERNGYVRIRTCAQARAVENHLYVAICGCVGNLPLVTNADVHYAQSGIFSPADIWFSRDGVCAESTPNIEHVMIHDLDLGLLRRNRLEGSVQNWKDRRSDMYSVRMRDGDGHVDF